MPATALVFMFDCYRPAFTCHGTDLLSGRFTISGSCWPFADAVRSGLHHLRVSVPEPCPVSDASHQPLDRVLACCYLYIFVSYAAIGACASTGRLISFNCFCGSYVVPVFRIVWITLSILQAITISDCIFFNGLLGRVV